MASTTHVPKELDKAIADEASFRKRVWEFLPTLLRSDAPTELKALTLIIVALFILMSFEFSTMLVEAVVSVALHVTMSFTVYKYSFPAETIVAVVTAFPLISRMDSVAHASRLEQDFAAITRQKRRSRDKDGHHAS
jgi:hypothetical protein